MFKRLTAPFSSFVDRIRTARRLFDTVPVRAHVEQGAFRDVAPALLMGGQGLYLCRDDDVTMLLSGNFFGCAVREEGVYVYQKLRHHGQLLKVVLRENRVVSVSVHIKRLPRNIHQIDVIDGAFFLTDPGNNRILRHGLDGRFIEAICPVGELSSGRQSDNYAHLNSVVAYGDRIYVIAHNYTQHSGRRSDQILLDRKNFEVLSIRRDVGACAHNTVVHQGRMLVCNSLEGTLTCDGKPVFKPDMFTRGLAVNGDGILLGGSMYGSRSERLGKDAFFYVLDHAFAVKGVIRLAAQGPLHDIRFLAGDHGMTGNTP